MILNQTQKNYIYDIFELSERFDKNILNYDWHIEKIDWQENYYEGENCFPFAIYITKTRELIDCFTSGFIKLLKNKK